MFYHFPLAPQLKWLYGRPELQEHLPIPAASSFRTKGMINSATDGRRFYEKVRRWHVDSVIQ